MRALIYVPIVHSKADLGELGREVAKDIEATVGPEQTDPRRDSIDAMWSVIRSKLLAMPLPWASVRVYQDGLPICGHEMDIVRELGAQGSLNHALLLELIDRGAVLMGTERPELLVREYHRIQRLVVLARQPSPDPQDILAIRREGEELLVQRDASIASRILSTLVEGERGVLFIGLLHRVDELLAGQLRIQHLIRNLPVGAEPPRDIQTRRKT